MSLENEVQRIVQSELRTLRGQLLAEITTQARRAVLELMNTDLKDAIRAVMAEKWNSHEGWTKGEEESLEDAVSHFVAEQAAIHGRSFLAITTRVRRIFSELG